MAEDPQHLSPQGTLPPALSQQHGWARQPSFESPPTPPCVHWSQTKGSGSEPNMSSQVFLEP